MTTTKTIVQVINEWLDSVDVTDVSVEIDTEIIGLGARINVKFKM